MSVDVRQAVILTPSLSPLSLSFPFSLTRAPIIFQARALVILCIKSSDLNFLVILSLEGQTREKEIRLPAVTFMISYKTICPTCTNTCNINESKHTQLSNHHSSRPDLFPHKISVPILFSFLPCRNETKSAFLYKIMSLLHFFFACMHYAALYTYFHSDVTIYNIFNETVAVHPCMCCNYIQWVILPRCGFYLSSTYLKIGGSIPDSPVCMSK